MGQFNDTDIRITEDGDLYIFEGDLGTVTENDVVIQNIISRIKSSDPEWWNETISANLEDLLGMANTRETGLMGEDLIRKALMADGLLTSEEIYIKAVPMDREFISYFVYFQAPTGDKPVGFEIKVNLNAGPSIRRIT